MGNMMATEVSNGVDVEMNNNNTNNLQGGFLLNTSSEFIPAHTPKQPQPNNAETPFKTTLIGTPSIPNTALRNLNLSTPIQNNEEKQQQDDDNDDDNSVINSKHAYIAIADNKRLTKLSEQFPQKTYTRIQAKNLSKLDQKLQSTMNAMMQKKT